MPKPSKPSATGITGWRKATPSEPTAALPPRLCSLAERTRQRNVRDCFDFSDLEDTQIGLPLMVPIQRIMIGTEILRQGMRVNGSIEHPAQCESIHNAAVNGKSDDASCKLIHHHQNPVRSHYCLFTLNLIHCPQRVFWHDL